MLNVFICEDNTIERNKFEKIIKDIIMIENLDMDVSLSTGNPEDILSYLDNTHLIEDDINIPKTKNNNKYNIR